MLKIYPDPNAPVWFDLLDPTPAEADQVSAAVKARVPSRADLEEIETTSRLRAGEQELTLSMPTALRDDEEPDQPAPLGFVITPTHLVTVRFTKIAAFDAAEALCAAGRKVSSLEIFATLAEESVDHLADVLEHLAHDLRALSIKVFDGRAVSRREADKKRGGLRDQLTHVGALGDHAADIRDALLGLERLVNFVKERTADWTVERPTTRLASLSADLTSLRDYEGQLGERIQFLLDALVGMIGIAQNEIFKVLTIVSIVGIPPTLIASIYGMNFKVMPELQWAWGYPYGLAVIALSALLPAVWFKWKGWF